jgi:hypothetical protein
MRIRRLLVAVGAPLILVVGLGVAWGVRKGSAMIHLIDAWSDSLEHSHGAVTMDVAAIPLISTLHVDGERVGKLSQVVVLREEPGGVDSLRFVVEAAGADAFDGCQLYLDPSVFEHIDGPGEALNVLKHVVSCDNDSETRVRFGSVVFAGTDHVEPLFMERRFHPCVTGDGAACAEFKDDLRHNLELELRDMRKLRDEIRREVRENVRVRVRN